MSSNEKLINFMHFLNSCTRNGDRLVFLIKTGNAYKERILPQTIINTFEKCERKGLKNSQK